LSSSSFTTVGLKPYDVVICGAGIAGSAVAIRLGRAGLRVALVERSPNPRHFKRACTHTIAAGAVPILDELGLTEDLDAIKAPRHTWEMYTRLGWIRDDYEGHRYPRLNCTVRREMLDPLLRRHAVRSGDVELLQGWQVEDVLHTGRRVGGVVAHDRSGQRVELRARLVVGADGRDSRVAKAAGLPERRRRHERFAIWGYFENVELATHPRSQIYFLDPECAYLMATDSNLAILVVAAHKRRLPEYRRDPEGFYWRFVSSLPNGPRLDDAKQVGSFVARLDMTNIRRPATAPGLALTGDAACAVDPVWGWGCGWALRSSMLLADAVIPALKADAGLERALLRYRMRHFRAFAGPYQMAANYSSGRRFTPLERMMFVAAARDSATARHLHGYVTSSIGVGRLVAPRALARAARVCLAHGWPFYSSAELPSPAPSLTTLRGNASS
jgi:flavin-dependent dehydrogenase